MQCTFVKLSLFLSLAAVTASDPTTRDVAEQTPRTAFVEGFADPRLNRGEHAPD